MDNNIHQLAMNSVHTMSVHHIKEELSISCHQLNHCFTTTCTTVLLQLLCVLLLSFKYCLFRSSYMWNNKLGIERLVWYFIYLSYCIKTITCM